MAGTRRKEEKKKKKTGLIVVIILLIVIVAGLVGYIVVYKPQSDAAEQKQELIAEKNAELGIIPGMEEEDVEKRLNEIVAEGMLNVGINPNPVYDNGEAEGNLRIENIPGNRYAVTVTITREDNGEEIYKSGLIDPGYFMEYVKLDKALPAGQYPCKAIFTAYDPESKTEVGTAGVRINIWVKS
ncbi:hypothetical protein CE91St36_19320 [Christensenellaceae bacterium]|nr:hypothetical protein CE91St36_19320 [Christensenellaceae bacterium]BDF61782.1 hypothetical protein CE91St37_19320 [Christensenellaceae bacterium]